jgi:hypothetical protein
MSLTCLSAAGMPGAPAPERGGITGNRPHPWGPAATTPGYGTHRRYT